MPSIAEATSALVAQLGGHAGAWALGAMRVVPTVALVPVFSLRGWHPALRAALGIGLAACVVPQVQGVAVAGASTAILSRALLELLRGLPVAVAAAALLSVFTMTGSLADTLRGRDDSIESPFGENRSTSLSLAFSLVGAVLFFRWGGPSTLAQALIDAPMAGLSLGEDIVRTLVRAVTVTVAIGSPLIVAAIVVEVAFALIARAASPAPLAAVMAPVRSLIFLVGLGLLSERILAGIALLR
jgi:type III secretory pathway component EscT